MKNKFFNFKLYIEGIKQTKIIGLFSAIILAFLSVAPWLLNMPEKNIANVYSVNLYSVMIVLYLLFTVITPLLTLYLFRFLNQRNGSDFFHAIPCTRICLFVSYYLAIITWILALALFTTVLLIVLYNIPGIEYTLLYSNAFNSLVYYILASIVVLNSIILAMTVTGNVFSNVMVSGIILFMPRLIFTVIASASALLSSAITPTSLFPLLNFKKNVVWALLYSAISFDTNIYDNMSSTVIYSVILSIILLGASIVLFNTRKSETASKAAASNGLQTFIRTLVTMLICLIPCTCIYYNITNTDDTELSVIILLYIMALIVYFLYELLSTKKLSRLKNSLPSLVFIVIANILVIIAMVGLHEYQLNYKIRANDIKSICIEDANYGYDYFAYQKAHIKLPGNEKINTIIENAFERTKPLTYEEEYNLQRYEKYVPMSLSVNAHNKDLSLNIYLTPDEYKEISEYFYSSKEYQDIYYNLPELNNKDTYAEVPNNTALFKYSATLYNEFVKEYKALSTKDKETVINSGFYSSNAYAQINVTTVINNKSYSLFISPDPKIFTGFYEKVNEYYKDYFLENKSDILDALNSSSYVSATIVKSSDESYYDINPSSIDNSKLKKILSEYNGKIDLNKDLFVIYIYNSNSGDAYEFSVTTNEEFCDIVEYPLNDDDVFYEKYYD